MRMQRAYRAARWLSLGRFEPKLAQLVGEPPEARAIARVPSPISRMDRNRGGASLPVVDKCKRCPRNPASLCQIWGSSGRGIRARGFLLEIGDKRRVVRIGIVGIEGGLPDKARLAYVQRLEHQPVQQDINRVCGDRLHDTLQPDKTLKLKRSPGGK